VSPSKKQSFSDKPLGEIPTKTDLESAAVKPVKLAKVCNVLQTLFVLDATAFILRQDL